MGSPKKLGVSEFRSCTDKPSGKRAEEHRRKKGKDRRDRKLKCIAHAH